MSTLTVWVARDVGANAIIRGLRAVSDFEAEMQMAQMNNHLSGVETIFIPTSAEWSFLASKLVREVWRFGGDVSAFVPEPVAKALADQVQGGRGGAVSDRFLEVDEEQPVEEIGIESILHQLLDLIARRQVDAAVRRR